MTGKEERIKFFGIRHHGPGSARSLLRALEEYKPDRVLVEGPADAEDVLPLINHKEMKPPVALFLYVEKEPELSSFFPFTSYSPEWVSIRWALKKQKKVELMDLPQSISLALRKKKHEELRKEIEESFENREIPESGEIDEAIESEMPVYPVDPIQALAEAAGFDDGERWWEYLVETRQDSSDVFEAISEAMVALREELKEPLLEEEALREAYMRNCIRGALKSTAKRIAVICGAWHVPALLDTSVEKDDSILLKNLPKVKTVATWCPWSHGQLARRSGYRAGIESPGWYEFLWNHQEETPDRLTIRWLSLVSNAFREKDLDVSSAHIIEAARLVHSLCALRGRPLASLDEFNEAIVTVLLLGDEAPLQYIQDSLIVGEKLGSVPEDSPAPPLRKDIERTAKSLRLPLKADEKTYELDLRKENDLKRSVFLHRLKLLDIPFGSSTGILTRSKGTFKEAWMVSWSPELEIATSEKSKWGGTVEKGCLAYTLHEMQSIVGLKEFAELILDALLADLQPLIQALSYELQQRASVASDIIQMMEAVPPLAETLRYSDVRKTDPSMIKRVLHAMIPRVCISLAGACSQLDDEAAQEMAKRISDLNFSIPLIEDDQLTKEWRTAIAGISDAETVHGIIQGKASRILMDTQMIDIDETRRRLGIVLSPGTDSLKAGAWLEGFLEGGGSLLVHSDDFRGMVDRWVCDLSSEKFQETLPVLRRAFSSFTSHERKLVGEQIKKTSQGEATVSVESPSSTWNWELAKPVLPVIQKILNPENSK